MRDLLLGDEAQFLHRQPRHLERRALRIAALEARLGEIAQMAVGGFARWHRLMRIILLQHVQGKGDAAGEKQRFGDGFRAGLEQARHLTGMFQMALGIGFQPFAGLLQSHMLADAGDDVLQFPLVGMVIKRIVDRDQRHPCAACDAPEIAQPAAVFAGIKHRSRQPCVRPQCGQNRLQLLQIGGRHDDQQQTFAILRIEQVRQRKKTLALGRARFAQAEKPAEAAIGGAILRIGDDVGRAVVETPGGRRSTGAAGRQAPACSIPHRRAPPRPMLLRSAMPMAG